MENKDIEYDIKKLEQKFDAEYAIYFAYNTKNTINEIKRRSNYMSADVAEKYVKRMSELVMAHYNPDLAESNVDEYSSKIVEARSKKRLNKKLIEKYKFEQSIYADYASIHVKLLKRFNTIMLGSNYEADPGDQVDFTFEDDEDPFM